jgi:hypothetical protein
MPKKLAVGARKPSISRKPSIPKRELIEAGRNRMAAKRTAERSRTRKMR